MSFAWQTTHYHDLAAYRAALLPFKKPLWITGITIHHTYRPTRAEWRGYKTMEFLSRHYRQLGWSAGPHLFLAAATPGPFTDGIWAGTPLAVPGVHAGKCNSTHIGIEVVGDYDKEPWPPAVAELVYGVVALLMQWGRVPISRVQGHRECMKYRTCPGRKIDMNIVRGELARRYD